MLRARVVSLSLACSCKSAGISKILDIGDLCAVSLAHKSFVHLFSNGYSISWIGGEISPGPFLLSLAEHRSQLIESF